MTRRDFLTASAVSMAAAAALRRPKALAWMQQAAALNPVFTDIRRNVGFYTCRGGTIGYLINPSGIAVVDSQYPDAAKACLDGINQRSGSRRIDVLINTHHHADHSAGNIAFKGSTAHVVASANAVVLQRKVAANAEAAAKTTPPATPLVEQVYADKTFTKTWKTSIGDETVSATFFAPAHTGGDIVVHFEQANVVHVGDLVFNRLQPYVDRDPGGASAVHWITVTEAIAKTYPADATYIFGHCGQKFTVTGTRADVLLMRDFMTALVAFVRGEIKAGRTREQVVATTSVLKGFDDHGPLAARALTGTFDELVGK